MNDKQQKIEDIINKQYYILVLLEEAIEIDRDSIAFKDFKHRVFENIEYLKKLQNKKRSFKLFEDKTLDKRYI